MLVKDAVWDYFSHHAISNHKKSLLQISKYVYSMSIREEFDEQDDEFYSWQYNFRWFLNKLKKKGLVDYVTHGRKNFYYLTEKGIELSTTNSTFDSVTT